MDQVHPSDTGDQAMADAIDAWGPKAAADMLAKSGRHWLNAHPRGPVSAAQPQLAGVY
jgi:hypothetical protein